MPLWNGGWGIRVRTTQYDTAAAKKRPKEHGSITGTVYELKGFPEYACDE